MKRSLSIIAVAIGLLACSLSASAQTNVMSDGVSVRNSAPDNVFFTFPTSDSSNVVEIQFGCSTSAVNHNYVYVYEKLPSGFIATYPFHVTVDCDSIYSNGGFTFTGSLIDPVTVNTPDHTITIETTTTWTAKKESSRSGYYWAATGGNSTIVVQ